MVSYNCKVSLKITTNHKERQISVGGMPGRMSDQNDG